MEHDQHAHLVHEFAGQLEPIFSNSPQAIYLYLDDAHKTCNQKFADLVGYKSIKEWVDNEYPVSDVVDEDQAKVVKAYTQASDNLKASNISVGINTKDGKKIQVNIIMVPITYKDEVFVLHFISKD